MSVAAPVLGAGGRDEAFRAMIDIKPATKRSTGFQSLIPASSDEPKRLVRGRVYELRDGERVPLAGVMVYDWQSSHRTFTDVDGRFQFQACWSQRQPSLDVNAGSMNPSVKSTYSVWLAASAVGYEMVGPWLTWRGWPNEMEFKGERFYERELETRAGAEIYMKRVENELVEIRLTNLHFPRGQVTVCLSALLEVPSIIHDERMAITTVADEQGRAWFSVPPDRFRFHGASGDGVGVIYANCKQTRLSDKHVRWEVPLEPCNNFLAQGVVTDIRDGHALPNVVVRGSDSTELTFTDQKGRFAFWISREPVQGDSTRGTLENQYFKFEADGYLWFTHPVDPMNQASERPAGSVTLGPGANEQGPWHVAMRPWSSAHGRLAIDDYEWVATDKLDLALSNEHFPPGHPRSAAINPDGTFTFEHIPWGVTSFRFNRMSADKPGSWRLKVDPASWQGSEPYTLVVTRE